MARVLVISFSDLGRDPRVDRQIEVLRRRHSVVAAGLAPPRQSVAEFIDISTPARRKLARVVTLVRLVGRRYDDVYWKHPRSIAALERLRSVAPDVVLANDLAALPIALRLGAPVVFDAHEHSPTAGGRLAVMADVVRPLRALAGRALRPTSCRYDHCGPWHCRCIRTRDRYYCGNRDQRASPARPHSDSGARSSASSPPRGGTSRSWSGGDGATR